MGPGKPGDTVYQGTLNQGLLYYNCIIRISKNAKHASTRKDTGLDQSIFPVQLFHLGLWKCISGQYKSRLGGLDT